MNQTIANKSSMKIVIRALYAGQLSILEYAQIAHIVSALAFFEKRLDEEMNRTYTWRAVATAAVEAGGWGAKRRIERRRKLLNLVNTCRKSLGMEPKEIGCLSQGIRYGYGVMTGADEDEWLRFFKLLEALEMKKELDTILNR